MPGTCESYWDRACVRGSGMISVVVPIFDEEENLPELRRRMTVALDDAGADWELFLVNDASRDDSAALIRRVHAEDPLLKLINLSRNFGPPAARPASAHHATGD